jgi:hypothetical protein
VAPGVPQRVVSRYNFRIEFGPYALEVDPEDGARIVEFSLDGRSVVVPRQESPEAYGSSFWPSPQSDWGWPPPLELDRRAWRATVDGPALVLQSLTNQKLGLSAEQRIMAQPERGSVVIEYTLHNRGQAPRRVAPWQNTRVRPQGLTFYPSNRPAYAYSSLTLEPVDGVVWFQHQPAKFTESQKLLADGTEGWVAHVDADLVFVKVFPDVPPEAQAPQEGEIVIYVHSSGRFVEVEQQGPYVELEPGAASTWTVHWLVRRLPPEIVAEPGSARLLQFVRGLVLDGARK